MKKYNIIWSPKFKKELEKICSYIGIYFQAPNAALKFRRKVISLISSLYFFPYRYESLSNNFNIRKISINNFIIIYEINELSKEVYILNLFHGSQNYLDNI